MRSTRRETGLMQLLNTMQTTDEYRFFQQTLNDYLRADIQKGYAQWMRQLHVPPQPNLLVGRSEGPPEENPYDLFRVMRQLRPAGKLTPLVRDHARSEFSEFTKLAWNYAF